jgi:hypothetical protein
MCLKRFLGFALKVNTEIKPCAHLMVQPEIIVQGLAMRKWMLPQAQSDEKSR